MAILWTRDGGEWVAVELESGARYVLGVDRDAVDRDAVNNDTIHRHAISRLGQSKARCRPRSVLLAINDATSSASPTRRADATRSDAGNWTLITSQGGQINGFPLPRFGVRVLQDRDEIRVVGARFYFSTEQRSAPFIFEGAGHGCRCPRCKASLQRGDHVMACAGCGWLYHQSPQYPCYTGFEGEDMNCINCAMAARIDEQFRFTPDGI
ncbi:MAG: hypothetical protein ACYTHJ_06640 [Planctomycetota bacterium]|jgi:hypothetical protein